MKNSINWIGIDDHADGLTIAHYTGMEAEPTREWEVIPNEKGLQTLVRWLGSLPGEVRCVYEAGPCGYELYRLITRKGFGCEVVAPSLTPRKPGDRVKTNRRDARKLATLYRGGQLTAIVVPDRKQESVRDLIRMRESVRKSVLSLHHQLSKFLLRHAHRYRDGKAWTQKHWRWIRALQIDEPYEQIVLVELMIAVEQRAAQLVRFDQLVEETAKEPEYAPMIKALRVLRGIDTLSAMIILAELGDLRRFHSAPQLMAAIGLVPSEYSTSEKTRRYGITKTGNAHVRHVVIEAAWHYQRRALPGPRINQRRRGQAKELLEIAQRCDLRLNTKFRRMTGRGKRSTVAAVAVGRELAGFIWAIGQVALV